MLTLYLWIWLTNRYGTVVCGVGRSAITLPRAEHCSVGRREMFELYYTLVRGGLCLARHSSRGPFPELGSRPSRTITVSSRATIQAGDRYFRLRLCACRYVSRMSSKENEMTQWSR